MTSRIVLASTSPRRSALLRQLGMPFEALSPSGDESSIHSDNPIELCTQKAQLKCNATFESIGDNGALVVGADTIVSDGHAIFEKPRSCEEAARFLKQFRNSSHFVYSAVCVQTGKDISSDQIQAAQAVLTSDPFIHNVQVERKNTSVQISFVSICEVLFGAISDSEIEQYVQTKEPYDKAGGYGIQATAVRWVTGIRGDYNCVVGLPVGALSRLLRAIGATTQ